MELKKVALPLSPNDMVEFFKDKSQFYEVDMETSLKDMTERSLLSYLANLGINCTFTKVTPTLMKEYMFMKDFVNSPMLAAIHANIVYFLKYDEIAYSFAEEDFGIDDIRQFVLDNDELIVEQCVFLDSFLLFAATRKEDSEVKYENVDEELHDEIGFSVLRLLTFDDFMLTYSKSIPPLEDQVYYTKYFDDYMFKGQNLFHYAAASPLFGLFAIVENEKD